MADIQSESYFLSKFIAGYPLAAKDMQDFVFSVAKLASLKLFPEYANAAALPSVGTTGILYIVLDSNSIYYWKSGAYVVLTSSGVGGGPISASLVTQDSTHRFATDTEKAAWSAKQAALGFTPENTTNKGQANGYASLGAGGLIPASQLGTGGNSSSVLTKAGTWVPQASSPGGNAVVPFSLVAYTPTITVDFSSSGSHLDITNVNGNINLLAANKQSGATRILYFNKTTANPITISLDSTTLSPSSRKSDSSMIVSLDGGPDTFVVNTPINSIVSLIIFIGGAEGNTKPYMVINQLGTDNAINFSANESSIATAFGSMPTSSNTTEQLLLTIPVPANTYKAGSWLQLLCDFDLPFSGNTGNVQFKARMGTTGLSSTIIDDFAPIGGVGNGGTFERNVKMYNISTTAQKVKKGYASSNQQPAVDVGVNLAIDNNIYLSIKKDVAGDTAALSGVILRGGKLS